MSAKLISIVTGTYNRLDLLQQMMDSVRVQLRPSIEYEFVICDGGSTDGTLAWLREQPDVVLLEHGELKGAIRAFTDAAKLATGDYVIMANDDILFKPHSILAALAYLEDNPPCIVAFKDAAEATAKGGLQYHRARKGGQDVAGLYAQIGMMPRWLGDLIGWWGGDDPVMSKARTYGADNYMSARAWEYGYETAYAPGADVEDRYHSDGLRDTNTATVANDRRVWHECFPNGAEWGSREHTAPERDERLRILYMPIYEVGREDLEIQTRKQKRGLRDALKKVGIVAEYDYQWWLKKGGVDTAHALVEIASHFQPDLLLTQIHAVEGITPRAIKRIRHLLPNCVVVNWNGDAWHDVYLNEAAYELFALYDVQLVVDAIVIPEYAAHGVYADYWQDASEEPTGYPDVPAHDVVFLGNRGQLEYQQERMPMVAVAKGIKGVNVGVYGYGWPKEWQAGETNYDVNRTHAVYSNARIALSDMNFPNSEAYVSNRFFNAVWEGVLLLQKYIPNFEQWTGFVDGKHYVAWRDLDDLRDKLTYYLEHEDERKAIADAGKRYARRWHSYDARVKELLTKIIPRAIEAKRETA